MKKEWEPSEVVARWKAMTQTELEKARERFETVRKLPEDCFHESVYGLLGAYVSNPWPIAELMAKDAGLLDTEGQLAIDAIASALLDDFLSPEGQALALTCRKLVDALEDPLINLNPTAVAILEEALLAAQEADIYVSSDDAFGLMKWGIAQQTRSQMASNSAKSKNAQERAWVIEQWHKREDKGQKKAPFARQHAALVKNKFRTEITPETISRDWLAGL